MILTAIMPTTNQRLATIPLAVRCLAAQRLRDQLELVIVSEDERARAVAMNAAESQNLHARAYSCAPGASIGAKRNLACAEARTPWITFWDDDDWSHPDRLRLTVARMSAPVELIGSQSMLIHELRDPRRRTFRYRYHRTDASYPEWFFVGGTLTFRRARWEVEPFPEDLGEEAWWQMKLGDVPRVELPDDIYVAMIHTTNAANRQAPNGDPAWTQLDGFDLAAFMAGDLPRYEATAATAS